MDSKLPLGDSGGCLRPAWGVPGFLSSPVILIRNKWQVTKKKKKKNKEEKLLILLMSLLDFFQMWARQGSGI